MGIFDVFGQISQICFNARPWNLVYKHIMGTFRCVWKMAPVGQIFGPILQNMSICRFSSISLKSFHWIHSKLDLSAHWSYFCMCVKYTHQRHIFWALQMSQNAGFQIFCQMVSFVFTSILLYMRIEVTFRDVYKRFYWFQLVLLHMHIANAFRGVWNVGPRDQFCGPFWAPKQVKIPDFNNFLKTFSIVSHQYCFPWATLDPKWVTIPAFDHFLKKFLLVWHRS